MRQEQAVRVLQVFFRSVLAKREFKQLKKKNTKRQNLLKEIITTEKVYVGNLEVLAGVRKQHGHKFKILFNHKSRYSKIL